MGMKGVMADFIIPSLFLKFDKEEYFYLSTSMHKTPLQLSVTLMK